MDASSTFQMNVSREKEISTQPAVPKNWDSQTTFSSDEVIDAYYMGVDEGKSSVMTALKKQLDSNIGLAAKYAVQLYAKSKQSAIDLKGIYLKVDDIARFSALFIVDKDTFISEEFLRVYAIAESCRQEAEKDVDLNFSFLPDTGEINGSLLSSDGYYLKYKDGK